MSELYEVYIEDTQTISKQVVVDVGGTISTELVSVDVPSPIIVGYYVVESLDTLKNDIFKGMTDFQYRKLSVAYGDISALQSAVTQTTAQQMVETLKNSLDEITFRNVLNFVFGKPLIEIPVVESSSSTGTDTNVDNGRTRGVALPLETSDITNALKEQLTKDIPDLQKLIEQKQQELQNQKGVVLNALTATTSAFVTGVITPPTFVKFVDGATAIATGIESVSNGVIESVPIPPPALSPEIIQTLQDEITQKKKVADALLKDQISLIEFRNTLLPLLRIELERFVERDRELAAQALVSSGASTPPVQSEIDKASLITNLVLEKTKSVDVSPATVLSDGTVVTPTKIFKGSTVSSNTDVLILPVTESDTALSSTYSPQSITPQKEDVSKLFLGTTVPVSSKVTLTEPLRKPIVLPPSEKIPEGEIANGSVSIQPNFGGSIMTQP